MENVEQANSSEQLSWGIFIIKVKLLLLAISSHPLSTLECSTPIADAKHLLLLLTTRIRRRRQQQRICEVRIVSENLL